jgi:hypothetical protein
MKKASLAVIIFLLIFISSGCAEKELKFSEAGTYDYAEKEAVTTDVHVETTGVILKNMIIEADLYIDESVEEGHVELHNVELNGTLHVYGGGKETIYIQDGKILKLIGYVDGRVEAKYDTLIDDVLVKTPGMILENDETAAEAFKNVDIELENVTSEDEPVILDGIFEEVDLQIQSNVELAEKTRIKFMGLHTCSKDECPESYSKSKVKVNKDAVIDTLEIDESAEIENEGDINNITYGENAAEVIINGEEITFFGSENYKPQFLCEPKISVHSKGEYSIAFKTNNKGTVYYVIQPWFQSKNATLSAEDIKAGKGVAFSDKDGNGGFTVASAKSVDITEANIAVTMTGYMGDKHGMKPPQGEELVFDSVVWSVFEDDDGNHSDIVKIIYMQ